MADKYVLEMDEETVAVVTRACEFYSRILLGQLEEVTWVMLDQDSDRMQYSEDARHYLALAKQALFPELLPNQTYGVGHGRVSDTAWHTYEVLRYTHAWHTYPNGPKHGWGVSFDKPMRFSDAPMPKCHVETEDDGK